MCTQLQIPTNPLPELRLRSLVHPRILHLDINTLASLRAWHTEANKKRHRRTGTCQWTRRGRGEDILVHFRRMDTPPDLIKKLGTFNGFLRLTFFPSRPRPRPIDRSIPSCHSSSFLRAVLSAVLKKEPATPEPAEHSLAERNSLPYMPYERRTKGRKGKRKREREKESLVAAAKWQDAPS